MKTWRGNLLGEFIGQTLDPDSGNPIIHLAVLAGSNQEVFAWGVPNLGAPNGIHICRRPADQLPEIGRDDAYVLLVERCRLVTKENLPESRMEPAAAEGRAMPRAPAQPAERDETPPADRRRRRRGGDGHDAEVPGPGGEEGGEARHEPACVPWRS